MLDDNQIYVVVDIETDGPVPGLYSMLSIGAVATTQDRETSSFYKKLLPYDEATQDKETMEWWGKHPEGWNEVMTDADDPSKVVREFADWVANLAVSPVFVASPLVFDFGFVNWYLHKFTGANPFIDYSSSQRTLDLASFITGRFGLSLSRSSRAQLPDTLLADTSSHTHRALDDARGYGVLLRNVLQAQMLSK